MSRDVDKIVKETPVQIGKPQNWQAMFYNMRNLEMRIKIVDSVLMENHCLISMSQKRES